MTADSVVAIAVVLPEILGTYGDIGNATVLTQRLRWRGIAAEQVHIGDLHAAVPSQCDLYVIGGAEDEAQLLALRRLRGWAGLRHAVDHQVPVLAVCAGLQILGRSLTLPDTTTIDGLGVLDCTTAPAATRAVGEITIRPTHPQLTEVLTGFENHRGATTLGSDAQPLADVIRGTGNGDGTEGIIAGHLIGTYLHGPVLARNPQLADLLLGWALGVDLAPLPLPAVERLRAQRLTRSAR